MSGDRRPESGTASAVETPLLRWLRYVPVFVLLAAIIAQAGLMLSVNADRQSGSGFAMFSSVDFAGSRTVTIQAVLDGTTIDVQPPPSVTDEIDQLLITPTDNRAADLAQQLEQRTWTVVDGTASADGEHLLENVTVVVRGLRADGRTLASQIVATGSAS